MKTNEQDIYDAAQRVIAELKDEISTHKIYIRHLEEQLEPSVLEELRVHLSEKEEV